MHPRNIKIGTIGSFREFDFDDVSIGSLSLVVKGFGAVPFSIK
jgi:hypothetical protein